MKRFLVLSIVLLMAISALSVKVVVFGDQGHNLVPLEWIKDEASKKGIEIEIVGVPFTAVYEKLKTEFVGGTGAYDLVIFYPIYLGEFADFGYLRPLDDYIKELDPHLEDVIPAYRELYLKYGGHVYALPYDGDILNLYYRRDLFENEEEKANFKKKYGYDLKPPETWKELRDVAEFFTRKKGEKLAGKILDHDFYGYAFYGARGFCYAWWNNRFASYGGVYFDRDMNPMINSEAGVKALEDMIDIMKFCPPDVLSYGYEELKDAFLLDRVAMVVQWPCVWKKGQDPKQSKIVGKIGVAHVPGVKKPDGTIYYRAAAPVGRVLGIPTTAKHPKEAYWIAWMLSYKLSTECVSTSKTGLDPYRYSHVNHPEAFSEFAPAEEAKRYLDAVMQNLEHAFPDLNIPGAGEYLDALDLYITSALAGKMSPKEALDKAAERWNEITDMLDRERQKKIYNNMIENWKKLGFWTED